MPLAAAMAAGYFGPQALGSVMNSMRMPAMNSMVASIASGSVVYYMLADEKDTTSYVIGAGAGYMGPMLAKQLGIARGYYI